MDLIYFSEQTGGYRYTISVLPQLDLAAKYIGIAPVINGELKVYGGFSVKDVEGEECGYA